jgi:hypothetical protein
MTPTSVNYEGKPNGTPATMPPQLRCSRQPIWIALFA